LWKRGRVVERMKIAKNNHATKRDHFFAGMRCNKMD